MVISVNYIFNFELGEGGYLKMDKVCFLFLGDFWGEKEYLCMYSYLVILGRA